MYVRPHLISALLIVMGLGALELLYALSGTPTDFLWFLGAYALGVLVTLGLVVLEEEKE